MAPQSVYFLIFLMPSPRLELRNLAGYTSPKEKMLCFEERTCLIYLFQSLHTNMFKTFT